METIKKLQRNGISLNYNDVARLCKKYCIIELEPASGVLAMRFLDALYDGEVNSVMGTLKSFFAAIPYDIIKENENYYQTAVHLIFTMLGLRCRSEVRIAAGRIDTLVETDGLVYCFEFKLGKTAEEALAQIDAKEYLLP